MPDESVTETMQCPRCGEDVDKVHPLDGVVHPDEEHVCDDCVKPWDEVVDV